MLSFYLEIRKISFPSTIAFLKQTFWCSLPNPEIYILWNVFSLFIPTLKVVMEVLCNCCLNIFLGYAFDSLDITQEKPSTYGSDVLFISLLNKFIWLSTYTQKLWASTTLKFHNMRTHSLHPLPDSSNYTIIPTSHLIGFILKQQHLQWTSWHQNNNCILTSTCKYFHYVLRSGSSVTILYFAIWLSCISTYTFALKISLNYDLWAICSSEKYFNTGIMYLAPVNRLAVTFCPSCNSWALFYDSPL